jgi:hypothetical protein
MTRQDDIYVGGHLGYHQLDPADSLAGEIGEDPIDAGYTLPERPPVTARRRNCQDDDTYHESLEQRLAEEEAEYCDADLDRYDEDPRAGRLVSPDLGGLDHEVAEEVAEDVGRAGWAFSAEEAAMHVFEV